MKLSKTNAAYLAGLVDGEGSIGIYHNGQSLVSRLTIGMTTPAPLRWVKKITGLGQIRVYNPKNKRHNPEWWYVVLSAQAAEILTQILPFAKVKHRQIKNILSFRTGIAERYGRAGLPHKERLRREKHRKISTELNRRGAK